MTALRVSLMEWMPFWRNRNYPFRVRPITFPFLRKSESMYLRQERHG